MEIIFLVIVLIFAIIFLTDNFHHFSDMKHYFYVEKKDIVAAVAGRDLVLSLLLYVQ